MNGRTWGIWTVLLILAGCSKSETEEIEIDFGYDYFPLETGRSYFYQVDSIVFDPIAGGIARDSSRTYVREDIVDTLLDNTGEVLYRLERYERKSDTLPWLIRKVLTLQRDEQKAIRTEDNLRFVKLVFPVGVNKQWKEENSLDPDNPADQPVIVMVAGESIDMFRDWKHRIIDVDSSLELETLRFDEVATVVNADSESNIDIRYSVEQYARGIGLVFRELQIMDTQCVVCCNGDFGDDGPCTVLPWEEKAERGFILRQQLIDYR